VKMNMIVSQTLCLYGYSPSLSQMPLTHLVRTLADSARYSPAVSRFVVRVVRVVVSSVGISVSITITHLSLRSGQRFAAPRKHDCFGFGLATYPLAFGLIIPP